MDKRYAFKQFLEGNLQLRPSKARLKKVLVNGVPADAKVCVQCGELKPLGEYRNEEKGVGGKKAKCKSCLSAKRVRG
ncbi:hypothetical protein [Paenibacillus flagellatus]|uniref:Stc1 domain-containing protein n=1 Tax=Paenibacillus flagellatus TaxID=2211139 RepID=A0A2V5K497_9BACL|nr:hypothetical protein [Paenibacillus flagellatus]PYI54038.1 hypothetical protein DLM86_15965 [Paenibacillus flagellatus]